MLQWFRGAHPFASLQQPAVSKQAASLSLACTRCGCCLGKLEPTTYSSCWQAGLVKALLLQKRAVRWPSHLGDKRCAAFQVVACAFVCRPIVASSVTSKPDIPCQVFGSQKAECDAPAPASPRRLRSCLGLDHASSTCPADSKLQLPMRAEADIVGVGGWFAETWNMSKVRSAWPCLTKPAQRYIACFETLAQFALLQATHSGVGGSRYSFSLPSGTDNSATEAGVNNASSCSRCTACPGGSATFKL